MRNFKDLIVNPLLKVKSGLETLSPARDMTPEAVVLRQTKSSDLLTRLWDGGGTDLSPFTKSFVDMMGEDKLRQSLADALEAYGSVQTIHKLRASNAYQVETEHFKLDVLFERDRSGKVKGIFIKSPFYKVDSIEDCLQKMAENAPKFGALLRKNGAAVAEKNAQVPMAVCQAHKIFLVDAIVKRIAEKKLSWFDKVCLEPELNSYPKSVLFERHSEALVRIGIVMQHMIGASDNSAADTLHKLLGSRVLETSPNRTPYLTSRQFYQLKANAELAAAYRDGTEQQRRDILEQLEDKPLPEYETIAMPYQRGVEWYASAEELCDAMENVAGEKVMRVNPGNAEKTDWGKIAFKAGNELGVLNFTYGLTALDGAKWQIALTWNSEEYLPEGTLLGLTNSLLKLLKSA